MTELATIEFSETQVETLARTVARDVKSDVELDLFLAQCKRTGLDPFTRQIYFMRTGGRPTVVVSIDGFRLIASRSGRYAGQTAPQWCGPDGQWLDVWLDEKTPPSAARVGVYLSGVEYPVWGVVTWAEFGKGKGSTWAAMPSHMLAKVAESHALRKAFPNEMSGLYTAEEMHGAGAATAPAVDLTSEDTATQILGLCDAMGETNYGKLSDWVTSSTGVSFDLAGLMSLPADVGARVLSQSEKAAAAPQPVRDLTQDVRKAVTALTEDRLAAFETWLQSEGIPSLSDRTEAAYLARMWAWLQADTGAEPFDVADDDDGGTIHDISEV